MKVRHGMGHKRRARASVDHAAMAGLAAYIKKTPGGRAGLLKGWQAVSVPRLSVSESGGKETDEYW